MFGVIRSFKLLELFDVMAYLTGAECRLHLLAAPEPNTPPTHTSAKARPLAISARVAVGQDVLHDEMPVWCRRVTSMGEVQVSP